MRIRDYLGFLLIGWLILGLVAAFQHSPGYMDADYYFASAMQIVDGGQFRVPFVWNYLGGPGGLPQPAYLYWMPLSGLVAALGLSLQPHLGFEAAQWAFILLGGFIPPLTAYLGYLWSGQRQTGLWAGGLALLPCFYLSFLPTSDAFGLYMLGGVMWIVVAQSLLSGRQVLSNSKFILAAFGLGLVAGCMHLARADGWLWLLLGLGLVAWVSLRWQPDHPPPITMSVLALLSVLAGYLLLMGAWLGRNWTLFGTLMPPGGLHSLWLTEYNDLYRYPAQALTLDRWLSSGIPQIIAVRLTALGVNLQTMLAVQTEIFLAPLVVWGAWKLRSKKLVQLLGLGYIATLVIMTILFPFAGGRGGFFHSGAAFQPAIWVLAAVGMEQFIHWGVKKRGWQAQTAGKIFRTGGILLAAALTLFLFQTKVIGGDWRNPVWDESYRRYQGVEAWLQSSGAVYGAVVMVNNPPGYYLASQRPAIVIPEGKLEVILEAATQYRASYLILEPNHPNGLVSLYQQPVSQAGLEYAGSYQDMHLFRFANHE